MIVQGTIVYDPVHRVPAKQETATRRTAAQDGLGHVARLVAHKDLQGNTFKASRKLLEELAADPHKWTRLGRDQVGTAAVQGLTQVLEDLAKATGDSQLKTYLDDLETKLVKTEVRPWTAIVKIDPQFVSSYLRQIRNQGVAISLPAWGPHVTFIRGEEPPATWGLDDYDGPPKWNIFNGRQVELDVDPVLKSNRNGHYWLNLNSNKIIDTEYDLRGLRFTLGLPADPKIPLHLTIGKAQ